MTTLLKFLVQTKFEAGLTRHNTEKALRILLKGQPVMEMQRNRTCGPFSIELP
jgi:hypothetical protein